MPPMVESASSAVSTCGPVEPTAMVAVWLLKVSVNVPVVAVTVTVCSSWVTTEPVRSNNGVQVLPPSSVFQAPPPAVVM